MINRKRTFRTVLALLLLAGLIAMSRTTQLDSTTNAIQPVQPPSDLTVANLLVAVNGERTKAGTHPLVIDPLLNQSAQLKADEIARTGVFEHVAPDGHYGPDYILEVGVKDCTYISENLAGEETTAMAVDDWMNSTSHREAMLDPRYDTTGFGISPARGYFNVIKHLCDLP